VRDDIAMQEKYILDYSGVDGRIILKWDFRTEFTWFRIGTKEGSCT
jgi:hypothetical protein